MQLQETRSSSFESSICSESFRWQRGRKMETTSFTVAANAAWHGVHPWSIHQNFHVRHRSRKTPQNCPLASYSREAKALAAPVLDAIVDYYAASDCTGRGKRASKVALPRENRPASSMSSTASTRSAGDATVGVLVLLNYWTDKKREIFVNQSGWWGEQVEGKNAKDQRNRKQNKVIDNLLIGTDAASVFNTRIIIWFVIDLENYPGKRW